MSKPYERAQKVMAVLAAIAKLPLEQQALFQRPIYYSRGKGGKTPHRTGHKHMRYVRAMAAK